MGVSPSFSLLRDLLFLSAASLLEPHWRGGCQGEAARKAGKERNKKVKHGSWWSEHQRFAILVEAPGTWDVSASSPLRIPSFEGIRDNPSCGAQLSSWQELEWTLEPPIYCPAVPYDFPALPVRQRAVCADALDLVRAALHRVPAVVWFL